MMLFLHDEPDQNPQQYDDVTLGYALDNSMRIMAAIAHSKGIEVNQFIAKAEPTNMLCIWATHSTQSFDWMFKFAVHCISEYHYRTNIESPLYLRLLMDIKAARAKVLATVESHDMLWWPMSDARNTTDIVSFSNGRMGWTPVQLVDLLLTTHQLQYQQLSDNTPKMTWTRRHQPHWLNRF